MFGANVRVYSTGRHIMVDVMVAYECGENCKRVSGDSVHSAQAGAGPAGRAPAAGRGRRAAKTETPHACCGGHGAAG
jgi:hypothetical protein